MKHVMKHVRMASIAGLLVVVPALGLAQAKPDFAGKWVYQQRKSSQGNLSGNGPLIALRNTLPPERYRMRIFALHLRHARQNAT